MDTDADARVTTRIYHRSLMQTERSQFECKRIMPKRGLPSFRHYPLTRGLGFLGLHRRPMHDHFSYLLSNKIVLLSQIFLQFTLYGGQLRTSFGNFQCRGVLLIWIIVGQGPIALAEGAGRGCLDIFSLVYHFFSFSLSLGDSPI